MKSLLQKLLGKKPGPATDENTPKTRPDSGKEEPRGPINREAELEEAAPKRGTPWIGVDLDGTLARYDYWRGFEHVGRPIPGMKARVLEWLEQGYKVKIFTARASLPQGLEPVKQWLAENGFPELEVTCMKDFHMMELWDDRAVQVVANCGSPVISARFAAQPRAPLFGLERTSHGKAAAKEIQEEEAKTKAADSNAPTQMQ